jgi:hypothetical protein
LKRHLATAFVLLSAALFSPAAYAQKKSTTPERCATMKRVEMQLSGNPALRSANEAKAKKIMGGPDAGRYRLADIVTIPVVVHVVLSNPYLVSNADVQAQVDRLNLDFSGLNADSTNATGFYSVRGRSNIRFCLARRTPAGLLTNGIERRASSAGSNADEEVDPIKRTAQGGLDAWDTDRYLNLWIGRDITGQGVLGYADNLGPGTSQDDGVFLNVEAFGSASCYVVAPYNLGRTATHEVGHYLGLNHIWGPTGNNNCDDDDFQQLPATTNCSLPNGLYNPEGQANGASDIGDTPNQGTATFGCPSRVVTDGCSQAVQGVMFQNFMDYTNDACMTLFSAKQIQRMEWVLANCRLGLVTSTGCQPPANAPQLDAALFAPVNPGGFEFTGCKPVYYPDRLSCPGMLTPKFRIENRGLSAITSLTVGYSYDGGPAITQTLSVAIPSGGFHVVSFAPISATAGSHSLRFFTANPNGTADEVTSNDSYTKTFVVMGETLPPLTEAFELATPLLHWAIDNPDFDFTWDRTTPGRNGSAGKLSIDNYRNDGYRNRDDLRSSTITVDPSAAYTLSFDLAHKNYPDPDYTDTLAVFVSRDCGQTFSRVYYKGGASLATAGTSSDDYNEPAAGDWRTEHINLTSGMLAGGKILIVFRNTSGYGNQVHIDNIQLVKVGARDLRLTNIVSPGASACTTTIAPSVTLENLGLEAVTAFSVGYRVDNGPVQQQGFTQNIAPGAMATVSLPQGTATTGAHTITAFSFDPASASGSGDLRLSNDTLQKSFTVLNLQQTPAVEGFETAYPPQGWTIMNPDNNATWVRRSPGRASSYSAFIDNYNNNLIGESDDLQTPFFDVANADSVIVTFDVAHKFFPGLYGASNDRLTVLTTTNCGNSYTAVYSKSGTVLATAGSTEDEYLFPDPTDWRNERLVLGAPAITTGHLALTFRSTNNFGNNVFIDNISVVAVYKRDLQLLSVLQPGNFLCTSTVTPAIRVRNEGTETVQGFTVSYALNNGAPQTHTATGLSLVRGAEATVSLPALAGLAAGSYNLRIINTAVATANGTTDLNSKNDTLSQNFSVPGKITAPLTESFAGNNFPPTNWSVLNAGGNTLWQRNATGSAGEGSAYAQNFPIAPLGQRVDLISPIISYEKADSVRLSFDLAAAPYSYATNPGSRMDTLEVVITKDCGASFTTVYKKWGEALKTAGDPFAPQTTEFFPQIASHWRRETIDLSGYSNQSPVLLFFRATNNNENNIFVDNVNFSTRVLPAKLKEQGFLLYPSPFRTGFVVWHYQQPTNLRSIRVMNAGGQTVWSRQFTGNADKQVPVELATQAAGVYLVELGYDNGRKTVVQTILKQ